MFGRGSGGERDQWYLLVQSMGGLKRVPAKFDSKKKGFRAAGNYWVPVEMTQKVQGSPDYLVATGLYMPSDGSMYENGEYLELDQPSWVAHFETYRAAIRRLNFAALWQRGDGSSAGLKNLMMGFIVCMALWTIFNTQGLKGQVKDANSAMVILSGQVARYANDPAAPAVSREAVNKADGSLVPKVAPPAAVVPVVEAPAQSVKPAEAPANVGPPPKEPVPVVAPAATKVPRPVPRPKRKSQQEERAVVAPPPQWLPTEEEGSPRWGLGTPVPEEPASGSLPGVQP
jgi:hypothetical protein